MTVGDCCDVGYKDSLFGDCSVCTVFKALSYIWVMNELLGLTESIVALLSLLEVARRICYCLVSSAFSVLEC